MLVGLSGPAGVLSPGDIYECDDGEAMRLISARFAVPFVEDKIERAVEVPPAEIRASPVLPVPQHVLPVARKLKTKGSGK
jgi:hypothetical protein